MEFFELDLNDSWSAAKASEDCKWCWPKECGCKFCGRDTAVPSPVEAVKPAAIKK